MAKSGDSCPASGLYLSTGSCGHAFQLKIAGGRTFAVCKFCGKPTNWTLLRIFESEMADDLRENAAVERLL